MNRTLRITIVAVGVIGIGLVTLLFVANRPLAKLTTEIDGNTITLSISKSRSGDDLYAHAVTNGLWWRNGRRNTTYIGAVGEIGSENAKIMRGDEPGTFVLHVGRASLAFDAKSYDFLDRSIRP